MAHNDLGKAIGEIVDQAINSKEFKELNKTINSSLVIALDEVQKNLNKAKRYRGVKEDQSKYTISNNTLFKNVSFNKLIGILMMLLGVPTAFFSGMTALFGIFLFGVYNITAFLAASSCIISTLLFSVLTISGYKLLSKANRFESYVRALKLKPLASIKDLANAVNKSNAFVRKEIEEMIKKGWFKQGRLDEYKRFLFVDHEAYETLHEEKVKQKEEVKQEVKEEPVVDQELSGIIQQGKDYVKELKRLNVNIIDLNVSTYIDHIEVTTTKIFEYVEKHPENIKDIRKFMKYYLPMTIKLLKAYEELEQQPISGENIENSKDEIEATLKSLDFAFMKILDDLFMNTAMDVSSDATVLENMLRQDGLSDNKLKM